MKKNKRILQNITLIATIALSFIACDEDFANVGSGIIGDANFESSSESFPITAYNHPLNATKSNGLNSYLLGYRNSDVLGNSTASIVGQMQPTEYNPNFGDNVVIESVHLNIPFFSREIEVDANGNTIYELDSVFGSGPIKISVYQNNYFLRDFNPNSEFNDELTYYSDGTVSDGTTLNQADLTHTLIYETDNFQPNPSEIIIDGTQNEESVTETKLAPALRLNLFDDPNNTMVSQNYWYDLFINKEGEPELSNANNFMNYFRGIYIKAEEIDANNQSIMQFNLAAATITINYSNSFDQGDTDGDGKPNFADADPDNDGIDENGPDTDGDDITDAYDADVNGDGTIDNGTDEDGNGIIDDLPKGDGSFVLNFTGNIINLFDNPSVVFPPGNSINGDQRLYLNGGPHGNMAILNLFNIDENNESIYLNEFKAKNWLINEANIVFHVDQNQVNESEPNRIYIYDLKNNTPIIDYILDSSTSSNGEIKARHLEPLVRVDNNPNGDGVSYKIRITNHINNIFLRDSTNLRLGLSVTSNVGAIENLNIKDFNESDLGILPKSITSGSFLSPKGTILYGNNILDEAKKVKLEIFYTEPN